MSNSLPFTIAIPTYDRAEMVIALVRAIAPQLLEGDEVVVINDGGDGKLGEKLDLTEQVRVVRFAKNQGMVKAWNACFVNARNDWVCIIHDDDAVYPHSVETIRRGCQLAGGPGFVAHKTLEPNLDSGFRCRVVDPGPWPVLRLDLCPSGATVHKSVIQALGGFSESFKYSADIEFFGRIMAKYRSVVIESPPVVLYKLHGQNYQFRTWLEGDFLSQLTECERLLAAYAGLTPAQREERVEQRMVRSLMYMFGRVVSMKDRALIRRTGRALGGLRLVKPNIRIMALFAATFGWVPPLGRID